MRRLRNTVKSEQIARMEQNKKIKVEKVGKKGEKTNNN